MPVAQSARRIPHNTNQVVSAKLEEMCKQGKTEKVGGATPWLQLFVVFPNKCCYVRLVVDMKKRIQPSDEGEYKLKQ